MLLLRQQLTARVATHYVSQVVLSLTKYLDWNLINPPTEKCGLLVKYALSSIRELKRIQAPEGSREHWLKAMDITRAWASSILSTLDVEIERTGADYAPSPCLFVSNHIGHLDVPVWLSEVPVTFVSRHDLKYWPIIGPGAVSIGTTFVNRGSHSSRSRTVSEVGKTLTEKGRSVVVFPEGSTSIEGKPWKAGTFKIAARYGVPVQAARIFYEPIRETAFVDNDDLVTTIWRTARLPKIKLSIEVFEPRIIKDPVKDCQDIEIMVKNSMNEKLKSKGWNFQTPQNH